MDSGYRWPYYSRESNISYRNIRYNIFGRGRDIVGHLPLLRGASLLPLRHPNPSGGDSFS